MTATHRDHHPLPDNRAPLMPWVRIDDTFDTHPKILGLRTDERRWTWQRILIYTCRHSSDTVPHGIRDAVPKATPKYLNDCINLGLIDVDQNGGYHVHDWAIYNAETVAAKVAYYLDRHPNATANQVVRAVGGTRNIVLAEVAAYHKNGTPAGTAEPPKRYGNGAPTGTESGTHARAPDPYPNPYP